MCTMGKWWLFIQRRLCQGCYCPQLLKGVGVTIFDKHLIAINWREKRNWILTQWVEIISELVPFLCFWVLLHISSFLLLHIRPKVIIEKSRGGRFLWTRDWDLGRMADFPAFIASKSFNLWNHDIPQKCFYNLWHIFNCVLPH